MVAREVIVGCHSKVWQRLKAEPELAGWAAVEIGHRDLATFEGQARDRVWVFAYSRDADDNHRLLARVAAGRPAEIVYVSSSSTIVAQRTGCYEYPRVKLRAEQEAATLPGARVLTLGLVYGEEQELPAGRNLATSYRMLAAFMAAPQWPAATAAQPVPLMRVVDRPFSGPAERLAHATYSALMRLCGAQPCLLRPLDLLLRACGWRWYGYTFLANRSWSSTTS